MHICILQLTSGWECRLPNCAVYPCGLLYEAFDICFCYRNYWQTTVWVAWWCGRCSFQCIYRGSGHSYKVVKLTELTQYAFRICASNDAGCGPYSDVFHFRTSKASPPAVKGACIVPVLWLCCVPEVMLTLLIETCKNIVSNMTYNVSSRTLNLTELCPTFTLHM